MRSGRDASLAYNRLHGKHQVRYADGKLSQPFCYDVACDYASIFGGTVEQIEPAESWWAWLRRKLHT